MLIQDRENPTGMFSKAGRFSIEMFSLLQEKDNIMTNKKKVFYPKSRQLEAEKQKKIVSHPPNTDPHPLIQAKPDQQLENAKKKQSQALLKESQPFTKTVSRAHLEEQDNKVRVNNQKFGMYNPKYHFIFEKSPFYQDVDFIEEQREAHLKRRDSISPKANASITGRNSPRKQKTTVEGNSALIKSLSSQHFKQRTLEREQSMSILTMQQSDQEFSILSPKIKGCLPFSRMGGRRPFADGPGPHEKRFEYIEFPDIYTKVKKPLNIYFQKAKKDSNMFHLQQSGLQYDINYQAIYPKSDKMIANFEKVTARKFPTKPIYTLDESLADVSSYRMAEAKSPNESHLQRKIPGLHFKTMLSRDPPSRMLPNEFQ